MKLRVTQYCVYRNFVVQRPMSTETHVEGLRERKKRETRAALAWAAVRLAVEHGYARVTVEDISAGAGVSPRTFNNYFSSKSEAIVARHVDRLHAIAAELRAGYPLHDGLWTTLADLAVTQVCGDADEAEAPPHPAWLAGIKLVLTEPAVEAELLYRSRIAERDIAAAIADRASDAGNDVNPLLVAAAVGTAIQVGIEQWLRATERLTLRQVLRDAFHQMGDVAGISRTRAGAA